MSTKNPSRDGKRHALREPLVWLVVGLPLAAVSAGISTLVIAIRAGGADVVSDPVQRTVQVQQADFSADQAASAAHLHGRLHRNPDGMIELELKLDEDPAPLLLLQFSHPTNADEDRQLALMPSGAGRWKGQLPDTSTAQDWNLRLMPGDARWRLRGRWQAGADDAELGAALDHQ